MVSNYATLLSSVLSGLSQGSLSVWVYYAPFTSTNYAYTVVDKTQTYNYNYYQLLIQPSNKITLRIADGPYGATNPIASSNSTLTPNKWNHIVTTWDGTNWKIYINGNLDLTFKDSRTLLNSNEPVCVGVGDCTRNTNYYPFNGSIDDLKVYNRSLSDTEIQQLYSGNSCPVTDTTSSYNQGYAAGQTAAQAACKATPSSCGITTTSTGTSTSSGHATYDPLANMLRIPFADVPNVFGSTLVYSVDLSVIKSDPLQFQLKNATQVK